MMNPGDRLTAFFDVSQPLLPFNDERIDAVARLLARSDNVIERSAERSPRTYILLRIIGRLEILLQLLNEGFSDGWFPITQRGLPGFIDPQAQHEIYQNQHLILTKSLDLENGQHCYYDVEEQRPFEVQRYIGSGSFGQIRVIESRVSYKQYALKTIRRRIAFGAQSREIMQQFNEEMGIMKRLNHQHVVHYVGSYTDRNDLGLIMSPIANCDLEAYLKDACKSSGRHPTLRTFFGCLATALSYLHDEGIKHRDIKPKNVLVHRANVLLADFGISRDFLDTTSGPTAVTRRYCAPEMAAYEGRNESSDVWSLGCVFLEMQNALLDNDLAWLKTYYETHGTASTHFYANPQATEGLLEEWQTATNLTQTQPLAWIRQMLKLERRERPTASAVMNEITASDSQLGFMYSCDQCCYSPSDSESLRFAENGQGRRLEHIQETPAPHSKLEPLEEDLFPAAGMEKLARFNDMLSKAETEDDGNTRSDANTREEHELVMIRDLIARTKLSYGVEKPLTEEPRPGEGSSGLNRLELRKTTREGHEPVKEFDDFAGLAKELDLGQASSGGQEATTRLGKDPVTQHSRSPATNWSQSEYNDLYGAGERCRTGTFTFQINDESTSITVTVPDIVIYCTENILHPHWPGFDLEFYRSSCARDVARGPSMTQKRFNELKKAVANRDNTTNIAPSEIAPDLIPLLSKYLESLATPIIPLAAQLIRRDLKHASNYPPVIDRASIGKHCLFIFDLGSPRRDVLLYLLGYMANFGSDFSSSGQVAGFAEVLVAVYRPYICGSCYTDHRDDRLLRFLLDAAIPILSLLGDADREGKRLQLRRYLNMAEEDMEAEKTMRVLKLRKIANEQQKAEEDKSLFTRLADLFRSAIE